VEEENPIPSYDEARNAYKEFQAIYGAPAFIRRARETEAALVELLGRCRRQREEWLPMVHLRLATVHALASDWEALRPFLADEEHLTALERLYEELSPRLRVPVAVTTSARRIRQALRELCESMELFNRRWSGFVHGLDLSHVNELRDGYNRWYMLEKECAVRSPRLARIGFVPLKPLTAEDVLAHFPFLPVPVLGS
jgi:hypothetical protein